MRLRIPSSSKFRTKHLTSQSSMLRFKFVVCVSYFYPFRTLECQTAHIPCTKHILNMGNINIVTGNLIFNPTNINSDIYMHKTITEQTN